MRMLGSGGIGLSGRVSAVWRRRGSGAILAPEFESANTITYGGSDIIAATLAGQQDRLPRHVGFIYGAEASPGIPNPSTLDLDTRRGTDWSVIADDAAAYGANVAIVPVVQTPLLSASASQYVGNRLLFTAHTGAAVEYGFPIDGSTFAADLDSFIGDPGQSAYFYQALLLNRRLTVYGIVYTVFARVSLGSAPFTARPPDSDLSIFWSIDIT